jgi:peptidyl-tRNA hydrolase
VSNLIVVHDDDLPFGTVRLKMVAGMVGIMASVPLWIILTRVILCGFIGIGKSPHGDTTSQYLVNPPDQMEVLPRVLDGGIA